MSARPPHSILFLHSSDDGYGSDRVLLELVDAAVEAGSVANVLLPDDTTPGWLTTRLAERGVVPGRAPLAIARRRYLRLRSFPAYLTGLVRARRAVRAAAERHSADVVHASTSAVLVAALVGRPGGCRLVWHVQELVVSPRPMAWLLRLLPMWTADVVIANSEAVAANLRRAPRPHARLTRVYNAVEPRSRRPDRDKPTEPVLCVFAGRLNRSKGYDLFVEAAAIVAPRFPTARFAIAGTTLDGEEWRLPELQRRLESLGIAGRTDVLGMCDDLPELLDRAHVVVVPSKWPESFGLVIVEAMQSGCAVLAADHGGARELVVDGVTGCLVPPNDAAALADGLARLLGDTAWRERIAAEAQRRINGMFSRERFSADVRQLWAGGP